MKTVGIGVIAALCVVGAAFFAAQMIAQKAQTVQKPHEDQPALQPTSTLREEAAPSDLSEQALMDATYDTMTLKGGAYIGTTTTCSFSEARFGDFDGDGLQDAAVALFCESQKINEGLLTKQIHLFLNRGGSPVWTAGIRLPNGVEWKGMTLGPGAIAAEFRGLPGQADDTPFEKRELIMKGGELIFAPAATSTRL